MLAGTTILLAAASEAAGEAAKGGLPQLDPSHFAAQLFWLSVIFVALLFIMSKVALPRVGDVIEERRSRIKRDLEAAARLKDETDQALANYEKALADARANASGIAKETRDKLSAETDSERQRVDQQIAAKLQQAESRIAETKSKAVSAIGEIASDTARAVVSKLIGQDVSPDEVKKALQPAPGE
ncbi:F0F1 ATP synthase subunit B' [Hyphomicrobium methylovorum]|uniref:F0F1 ATP synthase subunit B family protein n=1 Tax=Hyphomicrobium methylovorum TaxID=84 RepID=UPI0015E7009A|nr:F0F1 ATP synthase subunit B' [Hyphomicrobium methylovorum]MBA2125819.1 F0F1 ATP synthase subunit B' [Hyphomicrobium methylovorum]